MEYGLNPTQLPQTYDKDKFIFIALLLYNIRNCILTSINFHQKISHH